jgi:alpha-glucosidase
VPDHYNELRVELKHASGGLMCVTFRAYDEGAALQYSFPQQETKQFSFTGEHTEFRFPDDTFGYEEHGTEGEYHRTRIADIQPWCERPLTVEFAGGMFAALAEANNQGYPRMLLSGLADHSGLVSALGGPTSNTARGGAGDGHVTLSAGESTPWRVLVVGEKPGDLLERNYLLLNLNPPCALSDVSWIKPGKAMRDAALTTASAKAIIDLAPKLGVDYVGFDDHWFGKDDAGDATHVRAPNLDIKEVAAYGKAHNVGVCVYVDARQMNSQQDLLFPLFKDDWGAAAMKIGFVPVGSQDQTRWITDIIARAAEMHLVLDIHDGYRPTGNNRTYPNLLTVEGIRGNEHHPTPAHNCTLPFTRYIAGPGDYTVCYLDKRNQTTHAHQLAMGIISFSPMQWLYWYDRPEQYREVPPEMEFWRQMPTVWDETKVLTAEIGQFASIARRSGDAWFIGTINNEHARTLKLPLDFLKKGKDFTAHIYADSDPLETETKVDIQQRSVDSHSTLEVPLKPGGGQALWIEPMRK